MRFIIPGRLPGLNEIIAASKKQKGGYSPYNKMKKEAQEKIGWAIQGRRSFDRVHIDFAWYEESLRRADLHCDDLRRADLSDAMMPVTQPCPDSGAFIGWKKVKGHILKLQIPASADRVAAWGSRKCRASRAKLVAAWDRDGNRAAKGTRIGPARGGYYWTVGETHEPDRFCDDRRRECSSGLHFFVTRQEAEEWQ